LILAGSSKSFEKPIKSSWSFFPMTAPRLNYKVGNSTLHTMPKSPTNTCDSFDWKLRRGDLIVVVPKMAYAPRMGIAWGTNQNASRETFQYVRFGDLEELSACLDGKGSMPRKWWVYQSRTKTRVLPLDKGRLTLEKRGLYEVILSRLGNQPTIDLHSYT
jgi:hypothetical protein